MGARLLGHQYVLRSLFSHPISDVDHVTTDQFLWIRYWNVRIMLLTLSLKFGPPTKPVLEEVSGAALATLGKVLEWAAEGESIVYSANSAITNIAYGATILLKVRAPRLAYR